MMKNIYSLVLLLTAVTWTSCSNEEDAIFDQSAAERLNQVSAIYSQRLCDSPGGWVMEYYPYTNNEDYNTGVGYLMMHRFHKNGAVYSFMKNKANNFTVVSDSSAWEVITDMGPVLTFNTYNKCLGRFSDPVDDVILTPSEYDDESGKGLQGDYEFVMVNVPEGGDHIMLKGKKRGVYQRLTRVPVGTDFETYLDDLKSFTNTYFQANARWEYYMTDNGKSYMLDRMDAGRPTIYPEGKDSVSYGFYMPYLITKYDDQYHLRFKDTVMVDGVQMEQEYAYDAAADKFVGVNNKANTIEGEVPAVFFSKNLNKTSTRRWEMSKADADMSDEIKAIRTGITSDFKAIGCTFNSICFMVKDQQLVMRVQFRQKTSSYTWYYTFTMDQEGDNVTLKYLQGADEASTANLESIPSLKTFLEAMSQTFVASANKTRFDLNKVVLTSTDSKYRLLFSLLN